MDGSGRVTCDLKAGHSLSPEQIEALNTYFSQESEAARPHDDGAKITERLTVRQDEHLAPLTALDPVPPKPAHFSRYA